MTIINNPTQAQMVKAVRDLEEGKINTVTGATSGNFASFDANGNLADSGKKASDFLTEHQDISDLAKIDASNITNTDAWKTQLGYLTSVPDASTSAKGIIEIATDAEASAGTATNLAITPKQLKTGLDTVPTVNNGTLTIQKNGTSVATFTANQSTNATANITVPTKTSELTNDSGFITSADIPSGSLYKHEVHIYQKTIDDDDGQTLIKLDIYKTTGTPLTFNDILNLATTDISNGQIAGGLGYPIQYVDQYTSQLPYFSMLRLGGWKEGYLANELNHPNNSYWEGSAAHRLDYLTENLSEGFAANSGLENSEVSIYDYVTQIS